MDLDLSRFFIESSNRPGLTWSALDRVSWGSDDQIEVTFSVDHDHLISTIDRLRFLHIYRRVYIGEKLSLAKVSPSGGNFHPIRLWITDSENRKYELDPLTGNYGWGQTSRPVEVERVNVEVDLTKSFPKYNLRGLRISLLDLGHFVFNLLQLCPELAPGLSVQRAFSDSARKTKSPSLQRIQQGISSLAPFDLRRRDIDFLTTLTAKKPLTRVLDMLTMRRSPMEYRKRPMDFSVIEAFLKKVARDLSRHEDRIRLRLLANNVVGVAPGIYELDDFSMRVGAMSYDQAQRDYGFLVKSSFQGNAWLTSDVFLPSVSLLFFLDLKDVLTNNDWQTFERIHLMLGGVSQAIMNYCHLEGLRTRPIAGTFEEHASKIFFQGHLKHIYSLAIDV